MNDYVNEEELFRGAIKSYLGNAEGVTKNNVVYLDVLGANAVPTGSFGVTRDSKGNPLVPGSRLDGEDLMNAVHRSVTDALNAARAYPKYGEFDRAGRGHISLFAYNAGDPAVKAPGTKARVLASDGTGSDLTSIIQAPNGFMDYGLKQGLLHRREAERTIANRMGRLPENVSRDDYNRFISQIEKDYPMSNARLYDSGYTLNGQKILVNRSPADKANWAKDNQKILRYLNGSGATGTRQASKGGNARGESRASSVPKGHNPALDGYQGPKIMINPSTFRNEKDALCVAWNEAIRVFMEANGYEPQSEPTEAQRRFFADTPYADDELQLRRTIIARICVFDTSVKDPTDDQLSESASVLRAIIDSGFAKTDDEITKCERLARAIEATVGAEPVEPREEPLRRAPLQPNEETQAAIDAGTSKFGEEEEDQESDPVAQIQEQTAKDFQESVSQDVQSAIVDQQLAQNAESQPGDVDTSHIKYGPQEAKTPTMDDVGKAVVEKQQEAVQPAAPAQEQPVQQTAAAPQQETLAPGLSRSGSRNNVLEYEGRRISQREFDRIQAKFEEGGVAQPVQQVAAQEQPPAQQATVQNPTLTNTKGWGNGGQGARQLTKREQEWQDQRRTTTEAWMARRGGNSDEEIELQAAPLAPGDNEDEEARKRRRLGATA